MEKLTNLVVITGVSGSGKDYLLTQIKQKYPDILNKDTIINIGTEIFNRIREKYPTFKISSRDEIKTRLSHEAVEIIIEEIVNDILKTQEMKIINGHIVYKQNNLIHVNTKNDEIMRPRDYIIIESEPELIRERRSKDIHRNRLKESTTEIKFLQDVTKIVVKFLSKKIGARYKIINNDSSETKKAIDSIVDVLINE